MAQAELILLTGISGFIGAYIAHELLQQGYRVRGVVRSTKLNQVKEWYTKYGDRVEIVVVEDLVHGSFKDALKGVSAVIHAAAPLVGRSSTKQEALDVSIEGSLNILRQTEAAGVTNFVLISSFVAMDGFTETAGNVVNDKSWYQVTREEALSDESSFATVYIAQKTISEQEVWKFAENYPHLEVTAINPVFVHGPFAPEFTIPDGNTSALSTNGMVYGLLNPDGPVNFGMRFVDPRDVAVATVRALHAPPASKIGRKRFILSGDHWLSPKDAVEYISEARPELKDRLSKTAWATGPAPVGIVDTSRVKEVLGLEFTSWKVSLLDAVDALLALEKQWSSKGIVPGRKAN